MTPITRPNSDKPSYAPFGMLLSGRSWEAGSGYRYGFNGIERLNEYMIDFHLADFRGYNSMLARWISIDPIYKSYVSNYCALSNSSITRIDPRGDDDYFDIDGKYVGSDGNKTNNIYILKSKTLIQAKDFYQIQKDGSKLVDPKYQTSEYAFKPSDFYYAENKSDPKNGGTNLKAIAYNNVRLKKIIGHYIVEPVVEGYDSKAASAYYSPSDGQFHYAIGSNGKISTFFDNVDDMRSTICDHEDIHKSDYSDPNFIMSYKRHAEIYLNQIESDGFKNTTDHFQKSIITGAVDRYFKSFSDYESLSASINNVNAALKAQGIQYQVTNVSYLGTGSYTITNTVTGVSTGTHYVEKINSPEE